MAARFVAIGASAGGLHALCTILSELPSDLNASVAIVQHRRPDESSLLGDLLSRRSRLPVVEPCHGTPIRVGHVYLAPSNYHLLVEPGSIALSVDPPVCFSRPSVDLLFESVAQAYRSLAIGVVLTGANADGARGARSLARAGAPILVQDPRHAESPASPLAALEQVPTATVLPLEEMADHLAALCAERSRAR